MELVNLSSNITFTSSSETALPPAPNNFSSFLVSIAPFQLILGILQLKKDLNALLSNVQIYLFALYNPDLDCKLTMPCCDALKHAAQVFEQLCHWLRSAG